MPGASPESAMKGRLSDSRNDRPRMATDGHGWPRDPLWVAMKNSSNMVKKWRFNWFKYFKYQKWWTHGELKLILPPKILRHWICQENEDEIQPYLYLFNGAVAGEMKRHGDLMKQYKTMMCRPWTLGWACNQAALSSTQPDRTCWRPCIGFNRDKQVAHD